MSNVVVPEWEDRNRASKRLAESTTVASAEAPGESVESTLGSLVELLRVSARCTEAAVFEYRTIPGQPVVAGRFACGPSKQPSSSLLAAVIADKQSQIGASDSFPLTRERANHVFGLRLSHQGTALAGGYVVFTAEPLPQDLAAIRTISVLGANVLSGLRALRARQQNESNGQAFHSRLAEVLHFAADAYWEADSSYIIRKVIHLGALS